MIYSGTAAVRPVHPGEVLATVIIPASRLTKSDVARRLGVSRQSLYGILDGSQAVTAAMALRLGRLFGNSPQFWLNLQSNYDLKRTEAMLADELSTITAIDPEAGDDVPARTSRDARRTASRRASTKSA